ncbi:hypothetical protein FE810_14465 [Thalassotalea litorea]|uniref:Lipoprotein n=1 Tax=Thalassotalea litorea TaxID=2020715 RepID=A0A5R9IJF0_9GAMM|nr:hypothetical protein [Thalassotalea litorea]TLU61442.1 hypothetical protein FE810_14465 [Thalassotalea litorea]
MLSKVTLILVLLFSVSACSYFEGSERKSDDFNFDQDMVTGIRLVECTEQDDAGFCVSAQCDADDLDNCEQWLQQCKDQDLQSKGNKESANCMSR